MGRFLGTPECYALFLELGIPRDRAISLDVKTTIKLSDFEVTPVLSIPEATVRLWKEMTGRTLTTHYGYVFDFSYVRLYNMGDSSPDVVEEPI